MVTARTLLVAICLSATLAVGCTHELSEEESQQVEALKADLAELEAEIESAEAKNQRYTGGLVKALVETRVEVLKSTRALVQQRIHAIESGADIEITIAAVEPDPERAEELAADIQQQLTEVEEARREAEGRGGLIGAMKATTAATAEQTLAMLKMAYLSAKHGLLVPAVGDTAAEASSTERPTAPAAGLLIENAGTEEEDLQYQIIVTDLLNKRATKEAYEDYVFFDMRHVASGLDKRSRAIKGAVQFQDLFGETKLSVGWTLDTPLDPGEEVVERGVGFEYNQFMDSHRWVLTTALSDMQVRFRVDSILYADGERRDL